MGPISGTCHRLGAPRRVYLRRIQSTSKISRKQPTEATTGIFCHGEHTAQAGSMEAADGDPWRQHGISHDLLDHHRKQPNLEGEAHVRINMKKKVAAQSGGRKMSCTTSLKKGEDRREQSIACCTSPLPQGFGLQCCTSAHLLSRYPKLPAFFDVAARLVSLNSIPLLLSAQVPPGFRVHGRLLHETEVGIPVTEERFRSSAAPRHRSERA
ncbi:hypothetical protein KSP40_PGU010917 [Platanthera guangdongensis]|uniref:Uncharacterized protein n=1 Tax=Platanthera guangdongensis TaxID=2320717 RepID=A0ABR2N154_9ASPA